MPRVFKFLLLFCVGFLSLTNACANNFAYIVVEEKSGKVLASHRADELRPPASLTKKMTLYLIFEALRAGKISLQTKFSVSRRATVQEPCKLGLREGQIINVKDIIYALVTRSANDAAIVIAEGLCGSVEKFVSLMNQKAKALGMSYTHFYNTSGLPSYSTSGMLDRSQVTTARDMMILAKALYRDFPKEYSYFKIKQFYYNGKPIRNHNKMLGSFQGLDGIKTGYTNASRFNISVSAQRLGPDGKPIRLFAVVLGGKTSVSRDRKAAELMEVAFKKLNASSSRQSLETSDSMDQIIFENDDDEENGREKNIKKMTQVSAPKILTIPTEPKQVVSINNHRELPNGWVRAKHHLKA